MTKITIIHRSNGSTLHVWEGESETPMRDAVLDAIAKSVSLARADLAGADLAGIRADFRAILDAAPAEVPGLLAALREGRVDGSCYEGTCACLVGTIANVRGAHYTDLTGIEPNADRPAERWFLAIVEGDKPETSPVVRITVGWIEEWQTERARAATPEVST